MRVRRGSGALRPADFLSRWFAGSSVRLGSDGLLLTIVLALRNFLRR